MVNGRPLKALLIAEASGGHLIPALELTSALARAGAVVKLWYARRRATAPLTRLLIAQALATLATETTRESRVEVEPIFLAPSRNPARRLWHGAALWRRTQRCVAEFAPHVVVGFGGWVSAPVLLAAMRRRIACLLHEQNVLPGRANRWLVSRVDRVALAFRDTRALLNGPRCCVVGLPVRREIGRLSRSEAAQQLGLRPDQPTVLVIGGSQGSRTLNRLMVEAMARATAEERQRWQVIHVAGPDDEQAVRAAYAAAAVQARVAAALSDMAAAYAQADLVVSRAGASTIAELARVGLPALLVPYPHAGGHQLANARMVEAIGGGWVFEEPRVTAEALLGALRRLLADHTLRALMGSRMRRLDVPEATEQLARAVMELAQARVGQAAASALVRP
jgi:UDP-N-acetylglucosamine--N-acetylmuramyl-(pentapeptide) pyrophosphoryl-undecaprenol N-acetylglucosamine transferase